MSPEARREAGPPRGIVASDDPDGDVEHRRLLPSPALAPFVAHFWSVAWRLRAPFTAKTLPHPCVHITFERSDDATLRAGVGGVRRRRFEKVLRGEGSVFGIKFRPGAFAPLSDAPASALTERVVAVDEIFGERGSDLARAIFASEELEERIALAEAFLEPRLPTDLPEELVELRDLCERMAVDATLLGVEDCARVSGLDRRTLERRFRRYVGVGPKWVLCRYRLHEAAARLDAPKRPTLAALAAELGYADQAHFARDFKATIGQTPRAFVAALAKREPPPM